MPGGGGDMVFGQGGADTIHDRRGEDELLGVDGDDTLYGEGGGDFLRASTGSNEYFGGSGPDGIHAGLSTVGEVETVSGGPGNDDIFAPDGVRDNIDCGSGTDTVAHDVLDKIADDCEFAEVPGM
jgi:hypothetical protein